MRSLTWLRLLFGLAAVAMQQLGALTLDEDIDTTLGHNIPAAKSFASALGQAGALPRGLGTFIISQDDLDDLDAELADLLRADESARESPATMAAEGEPPPPSTASEPLQTASTSSLTLGEFLNELPKNNAFTVEPKISVTIPEGAVAGDTLRIESDGLYKSFDYRVPKGARAGQILKVPVPPDLRSKLERGEVDPNTRVGVDAESYDRAIKEAREVNRRGQVRVDPVDPSSALPPGMAAAAKAAMANRPKNAPPDVLSPALAKSLRQAIDGNHLAPLAPAVAKAATEAIKAYDDAQEGATASPRKGTKTLGTTPPDVLARAAEIGVVKAPGPGHLHINGGHLHNTRVQSGPVHLHSVSAYRDKKHDEKGVTDAQRAYVARVEAKLMGKSGAASRRKRCKTWAYFRECEDDNSKAMREACAHECQLVDKKMMKLAKFSLRGMLSMSDGGSVQVEELVEFCTLVEMDAPWSGEYTLRRAGPQLLRISRNGVSMGSKLIRTSCENVDLLKSAPSDQTRFLPFDKDPLTGAQLVIDGGNQIGVQRDPDTDRFHAKAKEPPLSAEPKAAVVTKKRPKRPKVVDPVAQMFPGATPITEESINEDGHVTKHPSYYTDSDVQQKGKELKEQQRLAKQIKQHEATAKRNRAGTKMSPDKPILEWNYDQWERWLSKKLRPLERYLPWNWSFNNTLTACGVLLLLDFILPRGRDYLHRRRTDRARSNAGGRRNSMKQN